MVQFLTKLHVVFFFFFYFSMGLASDGLTLEDRLTQLTDNYVQFKEEFAIKSSWLSKKISELEKKKIRFEALKIILEEQKSFFNVLQKNAPSSCVDLRQIGHKLSGLYSVKGENHIETIFCDFTKVPNDPGFQTWVGHLDIKTSYTYFYVQRNQSFNLIKNQTLHYDLESLNVGGAMDLSKGIFTAPKKGIYFFSFSGNVFFNLPTQSVSSVFSTLGLYLNDNVIATGNAAENILVGESGYALLSIKSTISLEPGDEIKIQVKGVSVQYNGVLYDSSGIHMTHFTGWLMA